MHSVLLFLLLLQYCYCHNFYNLKGLHTAIHKKPIIFKNISFNKNKNNLISEYESYMKDKDIYYFNMEETICYTKNEEYLHSIPYYKNIFKINKLYEDGNEIHFITKRNLINDEKLIDFTERQLNFWNVKYNTINNNNLSNSSNINFSNIK